MLAVLPICGEVDELIAPGIKAEWLWDWFDNEVGGVTIASLVTDKEADDGYTFGEPIMTHRSGEFAERLCLLHNACVVASCGHLRSDDETLSVDGLIEMIVEAGVAIKDGGL